ELAAAVCPHHRQLAARFIGFLDRARLPLRLGIFVPLLLLLVALSVAAFGDLAGKPVEPARPPFPAHNFFLLGIRNLLWVFRLVGIWWIVVGALGLARVVR